MIRVLLIFVSTAPWSGCSMALHDSDSACQWPASDSWGQSHHNSAWLMSWLILSVIARHLHSSVVTIHCVLLVKLKTFEWCDLSDYNWIVVSGAASCCGGARLSIYCRYICYNLHDLQQTLVSSGQSEDLVVSTRPMRKRPELAKCVCRHLVLVFSCLDLSLPGPCYRSRSSTL